MNFDSPQEISSLRAALLDFYREHRRSLPWRDGASPYAILVSEIMLQQTRVETVRSYFERWMARFPTAESLAGAESEEVLRLWEGLGYYSRARNLHRAGREIVATYGGQVPERPELLRLLPGVGPYTAGAVASIAYGVPTGAVDGNVRRVLARLADDPAPSPARLEEWAGRLVDPVSPGEFNQALMELGSLVCTPRNPRCGACPVAAWCRALAAGTQEERPAPKEKKGVPLLHEAVAVLTLDSSGRRRVLLRRRPAKGLLGGMWEFPGVPIDESADPVAAASELATRLVTPPTGSWRNTIPEVNPLPSFVHVFSHRRVRYLPHLLRLPWPEAAPVDDELLRWVDHDLLKELPLPVAQRRIAAEPA